MCTFLGRAFAAVCLGATLFACATGSDATSDVGTDTDAGTGITDDGSAASDALSAPPRDAGISVDAGTPPLDGGAVTDSGTPPSDVFVPPVDSGVAQDSATQQTNCDTSTQANQQKYLAEYLVAASSQNPTPCGACTAGQCCFQVLCVAE